MSKFYMHFPSTLRSPRTEHKSNKYCSAPLLHVGTLQSLYQIEHNNEPFVELKTSINYYHTVYLHKTFTLSAWLTEFPTPLLAVQRYVPLSILLMFVMFQLGCLCSTSLSLPLLNTLVQMMFGFGLPVASQTSCRFDPSGRFWSGLSLVSLARTK